MGFRKNAFAKIWEIKAGNGNYADARISISEKKKGTDDYVQTFGGFVRFAGDAANGIEGGMRVKLGDVDVTNSYNKEKKVTYTNFVVFNWEPVESNGSSAPAAAPDADGFMTLPEGVEEEELPFN